MACAGMGEARAVLAARAAMSRMDVTCLISAGLAGAASPGLRVGDIVWPGLVIDGETGERFEGEGSQPVLVTVDAIASKAEKTRLQAKYFADVIDMEAVGVARVAREHGLEFRAVKAVSDDADVRAGGRRAFCNERWTVSGRGVSLDMRPCGLGCGGRCCGWRRTARRR